MTAGTATISIKRRMAGGDSPLYRWAVFVDDAERGKIAFRGLLSIEVEPGQHTVSVKAPVVARSTPITVRIAAGEHVHLICSLPALAFRVKVETAEAEPSERTSTSLRSATHRDSGRPMRAVTVQLRETHRSEERMGEEVRDIDNRSASTISRSITVSKKWSKTYRIGTETNRTAEGSFGTDVVMVSARARIEHALKTSYEIEVGEENTMAETVTITVPAHTSTRLILTWKRLWQHGIVQVIDASGSEAQVPFQVAIGVTFDQSQRDADVT